MKDKIVSAKKVLETYEHWADRVRREEKDFSEEKLEELRLAIEGCLLRTPSAVPEEADNNVERS